MLNYQRVPHFLLLKQQLSQLGMLNSVPVRCFFIPMIRTAVPSMFAMFFAMAYLDKIALDHTILQSHPHCLNDFLTS